MLPLITMHDGRKLGLRASSYAASVPVIVPVLRVSQAYSSYQFYFAVKIQPKGTDGTLGTLRAAAAGEVTCRVQYPWGMSAWTDFQALDTDANGSAVITVQSSSMRFPSNYQVTATHKASGAQVGIPFNIDASGNMSALGAPYTISVGSTQPATFQQDRSPRIGRALAFPEARNYPFAGLHQVRPMGGMAFPEVRSWTRAGPNPAQPGRLIRVRQNDGGPAYRMTTV